MADRQELLQAWSFPYVQHHGVTLVARVDAAACVERIFAEGCRFYGYDSFTLFRDGKIQPHMKWSPSWDTDATPLLAALLAELKSHPAAVTHYEFVFERALDSDVMCI